MLLELLKNLTRQSRSKTVVSVTGAVLVILYALYDKVVRPPRSLRHLPTVPFWAFFRAFVGQEHRSVMAQKLTLPAAALSPQGLYTVSISQRMVLGILGIFLTSFGAGSNPALRPEWLDRSRGRSPGSQADSVFQR